jgi:hypothetical protein
MQVVSPLCVALPTRSTSLQGSHLVAQALLTGSSCKNEYYATTLLLLKRVVTSRGVTQNSETPRDVIDVQYQIGHTPRHQNRASLRRSEVRGSISSTYVGIVEFLAWLRPGSLFCQIR